MKNKRFLALAMASILLASSFAACAPAAEDNKPKEPSSNINVEGLPIAKEEVTYEIMISKNESDKTNSQNEKDIMKLTTKDTNVNIEWREVMGAQFTEQFGLILSTGDNTPDAFKCWPTEQQMAENADDFYELTDETLETYAPNITAQMKEHVDDGLDSLRKTDGKIYALPTGVWSEYANWATSIMYIRKDWVEDLDMEMPKTIDDLYEILVAFKENDMNGNGDKNDEIPFIYGQANWAGKLQAISGAWGIAGRNLNADSWYGRVEDGKYILNITDQRFKDYLTEMNKWNDAGLINKDGFTLTGSEYNALTNTPDAYGLRGTWTPNVDEYEEKWAPLPVLTAKGYEDMAMKPGELDTITANKNGFIITSECEQPEGLLRWWDHLHSNPDWKRISRDGPEGECWFKGDDGLAYVKVPEKLPAGIANTTEYHNTYGWRSSSAAMFGDDTAKPDPDVLSADSIRYDVGKMYEEYFPKEHVPAIPVPAEVAEEFSYVKTEIETCVDNFMGTAVVNGFTDADWDAFQQELKDLGIDEWVTYYQNIIDGNF